MTAPDIREVVGDLLGTIQDAPVRAVDVPASTVQAEPTPEIPHPPVITIPARTELRLDPATLPAAVRSPDGTGWSMSAMVAWLWAAQQQRTDQQLRTVHGQTVFTTTRILAANSSTDVPVTWDTAPLAPVMGAFARLDVGVAWQGKITGRIKDGTITQIGCTVVVTVVGATQVVITQALPLTVHADGLYLFSPPFIPGA